MEKIEDINICSKCGGFCCKKSGCDYFIEDLPEKNLNGLLNFLSTGNVSIVALMNFKEINGKLINVPFLYLRARNKNRDVVDLLSMKTTCSMLTETGCSYTYEDRPTGGKNLVPKVGEPCRPLRNPLDEILKWEPYQKQLSRIVKRYTGKSVEEKIKEDAYQLFVDVKENNIEGVNELEIADVRSMIPMLVRCYPEEAQRAINNKQNILKNTKK